MLRGGSFASGDYGYYYGLNLHASGRYSDTPLLEYDIIGFRVAQVPEPCSAGILLTGILIVVGRRTRMV